MPEQAHRDEFDDVRQDDDAPAHHALSNHLHEPASTTPATAHARIEKLKRDLWQLTSIVSRSRNPRSEASYLIALENLHAGLAELAAAVAQVSRNDEDPATLHGDLPDRQERRLAELNEPDPPPRPSRRRLPGGDERRLAERDEPGGRAERAAKVDDGLQALRVARAKGRIRMAESYAGVVEDVHEDTVVVVYDVDGKIVEQTYLRSQFIDGWLPEVDTRLVVHVHVIEVDPEAVETDTGEDERRDDDSGSRRKPLAGPTAF